MHATHHNQCPLTESLSLYPDGSHLGSKQHVFLSSTLVRGKNFFICTYSPELTQHVSTHFVTVNEVVSYESPRPTAGIHRCVFILFRQSVRQTIYAPGWRQNFNTRDFSAFYSLGPAVAAVFFNCQRENGCGGRRLNNIFYLLQ